MPTTCRLGRNADTRSALPSMSACAASAHGGRASPRNALTLAWTGPSTCEMSRCFPVRDQTRSHRLASAPPRPSALRPAQRSISSDRHWPAFERRARREPDGRPCRSMSACCASGAETPWPIHNLEQGMTGSFVSRYHYQARSRPAAAARRRIPAIDARLAASRSAGLPPTCVSSDIAPSYPSSASARNCAT